MVGEEAGVWTGGGVAHPAFHDLLARRLSRLRIRKLWRVTKSLGYFSDFVKFGLVEA